MDEGKDTTDTKTYTVTVAFYQCDMRATVTVTATTPREACQQAVAMVDSGRAATHQTLFDPTPTFVYGVVEGRVDDAWSGFNNVPDDMTEDAVMAGGVATVDIARTMRATFARMMALALEPVAPQPAELDSLMADVENAARAFKDDGWRLPTIPDAADVTIGVVTRCGPLHVHFSEGQPHLVTLTAPTAGANGIVWSARRGAPPTALARAAMDAAAVRWSDIAAARTADAAP